MKNKKWILRLAVGLAIVVLAAATCRVTYVPDAVVETYVNEAGETVEVEQLSAVEQYCADNWDTLILPTIRERAVDVATFLADVRADVNAAGQAYGSRANETSAWNFCVTGQVGVLDIENADSANRAQLLLDAAPYDGQADLKLHFGKVFSTSVKNAIRDGVGFLRLDDYANQVEFADLSTAFNNKVKETIHEAFTPADLEGQEIVFYGCIAFQSADVDGLVVIPTELSVAGT